MPRPGYSCRAALSLLGSDLSRRWAIRPSKLWEALASGTSGVRELTSIPVEAFPMKFGAEARDFTGAIDDFGPLDKAMSRNIKKNLKVMCREMQIGIAAAQLALTDCKLPLGVGESGPRRLRLWLRLHADAAPGVHDRHSQLPGRTRANSTFAQWAEKGLPAVEPLWLLKYLPNLPASHIAIFNDLRGPNNSLTMREASSNLAIAEAYCTIVRGHADAMLAGATGTKVHPARTIHVVTQEEVAVRDGDPTQAQSAVRSASGGGRAGRRGRGDHARGTGICSGPRAQIMGEVIGFASSAVSDKRGIGQYKTAFKNVYSQALAQRADQAGRSSATSMRMA